MLIFLFCAQERPLFYRNPPYRLTSSWLVVSYFPACVLARLHETPAPRAEHPVLYRNQYKSCCLGNESNNVIEKFLPKIIVPP